MSNPATNTIVPGLTPERLKRASQMFMRGMTAALQAEGNTTLLTKVASDKTAASLRDQVDNRIVGIFVTGERIKSHFKAA